MEELVTRKMPFEQKNVISQTVFVFAVR